MSATVSIEMSLEKAKAIMALEEVCAKQSQQEAGLGKIVKASQEAARAQEELGRMAKRTYEETRTPQEQHNKRLEDLGKLLQARKIDQETYGRAVGQANAQLRSADETMKGLAGTAVNQVQALGAVAAGYLSIRGAISLVVTALKEKEELERKAAAGAMSPAQAQEEALLNLSAATDEEQAKVIERVKKMSAARKPKGGEATAWRLVSAALSATGGQIEPSLEASELAMQISPTSPEVMASTAAAIPDVAKMTGASAKENLGYLLAVGKIAKTQNLRQLSQNLAPAITTIAKLGATPEESGSLVTAIQQAMLDTEGNLAKTASLALATSLRELVPEKDVYESKFDKETGGVEKELVAKGTGAKTIMDKIRYLRGNKEARGLFLSQAKFGREQGRVFIEELLGEGGDATWQTYQKNIKEFTPRAQWGALGDDMIRRRGLPFEQRAASIDRIQVSMVEQLQGTPAGKERAIAGLFSRDKLVEGLGEADVGFAGRKLASLKALAGKELGGERPEDVYGSALRGVVADIRRGSWQRVSPARAAEMIGEGPITGFLRAATASEHETPAPQQLEIANVLERNLEAQLVEARAMRAEIEKQTRLLEADKNTRPTLGAPDVDR